MISFVSKGVALGVNETLTPTERGMRDQFEKVGPLNGVATRQHKDRDLQGCDFIDQMFALIRAQLHGTAVWLSGCAAMDARKVACLGHFPDGDEWPFVEVGGVDLRVHATYETRTDAGAASHLVDLNSVNQKQTPKMTRFLRSCRKILE